MLRGPGDVLVVNVCTGSPEPGVLGYWDRVTGATDSAAFMELRHQEDAEALALAGRAATHLGFLDAQYRDGAPLDAVELRDALVTAIPRARALHAPAGLGKHEDHLAIRALALELLQETGVPLHLYADLPYAARHGWPHWVTGTEPRRHLRPELAWAAHLPEAELEPTTVRLDAAEIARKRRALEAYRTQIDGLDSGPLGLLSHPEIAPYEVSWRVSPRPA